MLLSLALLLLQSAVYDDFVRWRATQPQGLTWEQTMERYRAKLKQDGRTDIDRTLSIVESHDEATEIYNRVFAAQAPTFSTAPNRHLIDAVRGVSPGKALDVGMGQGRNAIWLAQQGWNVTGFDVSATGLAKARENAAKAGVRIAVRNVSDEEFDFGREQWDLIAIIYAIENRSVHRVRNALKPGGLVVIEAGRKDASGAPFEFEKGELLRIFRGFEILEHEETTGTYDWGGTKAIPLVRFAARKPR